MNKKNKSFFRRELKWTKKADANSKGISLVEPLWLFARDIKINFLHGRWLTKVEKQTPHFVGMTRWYDLFFLLRLFSSLTHIPFLLDLELDFFWYDSSFLVFSSFQAMVRCKLNLHQLAPGWCRVHCLMT